MRTPCYALFYYAHFYYAQALLRARLFTRTLYYAHAFIIQTPCYTHTYYTHAFHVFFDVHHVHLFA